MIHFIVLDSTVKRDGSASIFPFHELAYVRVHPDDCDKIRAGLEGMFKRPIPVLRGDWQKEARKLLFGK